MSMIDDAYEFGTNYGARGCYGSYNERLACLQSARSTAISLVTKFFQDYPDYRYNKTNAEIVFQVLYFAVNHEILKLLLTTNDDNYKKFTAEIFANNLYNEFSDAPALRAIFVISETIYLSCCFTSSFGCSPVSMI